MHNLWVKVKVPRIFLCTQIQTSETRKKTLLGGGIVDVYSMPQIYLIFMAPRALLKYIQKNMKQFSQDLCNFYFKRVSLINYEVNNYVNSHTSYLKGFIQFRENYLFQGCWDGIHFCFKKIYNTSATVIVIFTKQTHAHIFTHSQQLRKYTNEQVHFIITQQQTT